MSKRLEVLKGSLIKKETLFNDKLQNHFKTVAQANGQPLNDKRNGQATLNKWERQNNSLLNIQEGIEKTKNAIENEEGKIYETEHIKKQLPELILKLIEEGIITQWRKHPKTFFVNGVDKARICYDIKKKQISHKYARQITDKEQHKIFAQTFNKLAKQINI